MLNLFGGGAGGRRVPVITPAQAAEMLQAGGALLVDVREPAELAQTGRLKGAINVPLATLAQRADPASPEHESAFRTDRPMILYCASGKRSDAGGQALLGFGYGAVYNLGGIGAAAAAGLPVERS
jgi:rhodanese-related sulfurtransferase